MKTVHVLTIKHYIGEGAKLRYEFENLGIFTTEEKAKAFAEEGGYRNMRADVLVTEVELDKGTAF